MIIGGLDKVICKFKRPDILRDAPVPAPLSGVNPRSIMGQTWWDKKRKAAYATNNYHCWACGVPVRLAEWRPYLEAHERYTINHKRGTLRLREITALCHACHNFIHINRLTHRLADGLIGMEYAQGIVDHGYKILRAAGMEPYWTTRLLVENLQPHPDEDGIITYVDWGQWKLLLGGRQYGPKFEDALTLRAYYEGRQ